MDGRANGTADVLTAEGLTARTPQALLRHTHSLTDAERMVLELLQEHDDEVRHRAEQRRMRFLAGVAARTGIPAHALAVNPQTGAVTDTRRGGGELGEDSASALSTP